MVKFMSRRSTKKSNYRDLRLLRPCRARPCRRAAEQRDELTAAAHSITSSARASRVSRHGEAERLGRLQVDDGL